MKMARQTARPRTGMTGLLAGTTVLFVLAMAPTTALATDTGQTAFGTGQASTQTATLQTTTQHLGQQQLGTATSPKVIGGMTTAPQVGTHAAKKNVSETTGGGLTGQPSVTGAQKTTAGAGSPLGTVSMQVASTPAVVAGSKTQ